MSALNFSSRSLLLFFKNLGRLGMRTLILTILATALLNVAVLAVISRMNSSHDDGLVGPPIVRQTAATARLMDTLTPEERRIALAATNSPLLQLSLKPDFSQTPPVEDPIEVFMPIISIYGAVLGDRPFSVYRRNDVGFRIWPHARLSDDLIVVMRLADGSALVAQTGEEFRRRASLYAITLVFGTASLVLIGLITWASLSYSGPLSRLANASRSFVEGAYTSTGLKPLPETGPKPVRELAAALNLAGSNLVRLTMERTTTLAAIAHDLRTYLTRLRMRSEFIEDDATREKTVRDIEDMTQLIEDTLFLGEAVTKDPVLEQLNLSEWLTDFVSRRAEFGQAVTLARPEQSALVKVSVPELTRVLNNLVDNALRYAGQADLRLSDPDGDHFEIQILDRGPGVPADFVDRMSDPFSRLETSRSRDTGGAGLGLAISKALVEQIGGTLNLSNREDGGFNATITLSKAAREA